MTRQTLTTLAEVVGLMFLAAAFAVAVSSLVVFFAIAGVVLVGAGILEGRR